MKNTEMLKKNYEFKNVLSKGKFSIAKKLQIVILKNNKNINYLGIAISTKNGKAFQRNKIKRLIRECYRLFEDKLYKGFSIVILIKKNIDIESIKYIDVFNDIEYVFNKANIVKKEEKNEKNTYLFN